MLMHTVKVEIKKDLKKKTPRKLQRTHVTTTVSEEVPKLTDFSEINKEKKFFCQRDSDLQRQTSIIR